MPTAPPFEIDGQVLKQSPIYRDIPEFIMQLFSIDSKGLSVEEATNNLTFKRIEENNVENIRV